MNKNNESGFSYIDVMIAIVILLVGILALMSAITSAVVLSGAQEQQLTAKQIVASTMEAIISTKETDPNRLGWASVGNIGSNPDKNGVNQGIFVTGVQPVRTDPGPDQIIGTADDTGAIVEGFTREIIITDECDPERPSANCSPVGDYDVKVRTIRINVFYNFRTIRNQESLRTVLTDYTIDE